MMRAPALTALLLLSAGLGGCASEPPFPMLDYRYHQRGLVKVCYDPARNGQQDAARIAHDLCRRLDRVAELQEEIPHQCSWTNPTQAVYLCVPRPGETPVPLSPRYNPLRKDSDKPVK